MVRWRKDRRWWSVAALNVTRSRRSQLGRGGITATTLPERIDAKFVFGDVSDFLIVEPMNDPGRYDQEVLLAAHHWEGSWVSMQDIRRGPPPDNGLEVMYTSASFNDKMLGHGEPIRVREGQRVLFRLLNASPTQNITLGLPGHRFTVIALDGNPVLTQRSVDTLSLAPAERADAIVR